MEYLFFIWAGTSIMAFSCIRVILVETLVVGRQRVLEIIVLYVE